MSEFRFQEMFELGDDGTEYRRLDDASLVRVDRVGDREVLVVEPEALRQLAAAAIRDVSHLFRPGHLQQLRRILERGLAYLNLHSSVFAAGELRANVGCDEAPARALDGAARGGG